MSELKPCKKHNVKPYLKEISFGNDPYQNQFPQQKRFEYVCDACELEKEMMRKQPLIDEWNRKQELLK